MYEYKTDASLALNIRQQHNPISRSFALSHLRNFPPPPPPTTLFTLLPPPPPAAGPRAEVGQLKMGGGTEKEGGGIQEAREGESEEEGGAGEFCTEIGGRQLLIPRALLPCNVPHPTPPSVFAFLRANRARERDREVISQSRTKTHRGACNVHVRVSIYIRSACLVSFLNCPSCDN